MTTTKPKARAGKAATRRDTAHTAATGGGFGTALLTEAERERLAATAAAGGPLAAAWARFRLRTDDNRRRVAGLRATGATAATVARAVQVSPTGVTGPGGGRSRVIAVPPEYRGTTSQVAGLWPWCVGAGAPILGTPLGPHLETGEPVCFDPLNWFARGKFITAPSLFVLALNGFGKSSLVRRLVLGGIAQGVTPLILADVKPDYRDLIGRCGGQVIDLGYGHGRWNPLDPGVMGAAIARLEDAGHTEEAARMRIALRARQTNILGGLIELVRGQRIADYEETLVATALRVLDERAVDGFVQDQAPILSDLAAVLDAGTEDLMLDAVAATEADYRAAVIPLLRSLRALTRGPYGALFDGQTTTRIDIDSVGVCVDVSHLPDDRKLRAAVMLVTWNSGFASIEAANALAAVGLERQRNFQVVMDELWQVLGLGEFMVDRVDELTRLQRVIGAALILISHSIRDLKSLHGAAADRAIGFLERARVKILGALPEEELAALARVVKLTAAEATMVTGWSAPQALTGEPIRRPRLEDEDAEAAPPASAAVAPGTGHFLLKYTENATPGIPFLLLLTATDRASGIHETSSKFSEFGTRRHTAAASGRA
ncbi:hypothetical protein [Nocardia sp. NPDC050435]|uniref:hypothetical protein n=1 Tax=Nocardia sp. NPDC050435 TaxID=3155040 RepID=UPI0033FD34BF